MRCAPVLVAVLGCTLFEGCAPSAEGLKVVNARLIIGGGSEAELAAELDREPALARMRMVDGNEETALHYAAEVGNLKAIELLLARGADPNAQDMNGWTPVIRSILGKQPAALRLLLQRGADPKVKDASGFTAAIHVWNSGSDPALTAVLSEFGIVVPPPGR